MLLPFGDFPFSKRRRSALSTTQICLYPIIFEIKFMFQVPRFYCNIFSFKIYGVTYARWQFRESKPNLLLDKQLLHWDMPLLLLCDANYSQGTIALREIITWWYRAAHAAAYRLKLPWIANDNIWLFIQ